LKSSETLNEIKMEPGILTTTLNSFLNVFSHGWGNLHPSINFLTKIFLGIEIVMMGLWMALGGMDNIASIMKKMLYLMVWLWIVNNFPMLSNAFVRSLIQAGQTAGGGTGGNLFDPSAVLRIGLNTVATAQEEVAKINVWEIGSFGDIIVLEICLLLIAIGYLIIAWQIFYAVLEFYIIAALVGLFMPFGFFEPTKFLAEKGIGAVVASGIKLMVLAFILAVMVPMLTTIHFSGDLTFREALSALLIVGALAFLTIQAPGVASGLMAGSPSLTVGGAVQNAAVAGGGAAMAAFGLASAGGAMAKSVGAAASAFKSGGAIAAASSVAGSASAAPAASASASPSTGSAASGGSGGGNPSAGGDQSSDWARAALAHHSVQPPDEGHSGGGVQVKL
jgi:type IV secretion system protein TrbL